MRPARSASRSESRSATSTAASAKVGKGLHHGIQRPDAAKVRERDMQRDLLAGLAHRRHRRLEGQGLQRVWMDLAQEPPEAFVWIERQPSGSQSA